MESSQYQQGKRTHLESAPPAISASTTTTATAQYRLHHNSGLSSSSSSLNSALQHQSAVQMGSAPFLEGADEPLTKRPHTTTLLQSLAAHQHNVADERITQQLTQRPRSPLASNAAFNPRTGPTQSELLAMLKQHIGPASLFNQQVHQQQSGSPSSASGTFLHSDGPATPVSPSVGLPTTPASQFLSTQTQAVSSNAPGHRKPLQALPRTKPAREAPFQPPFYNSAIPEATPTANNTAAPQELATGDLLSFVVVVMDTQAFHQVSCYSSTTEEDLDYIVGAVCDVPRKSFVLRTLSGQAITTGADIAARWASTSPILLINKSTIPTPPVTLQKSSSLAPLASIMQQQQQQQQPQFGSLLSQGSLVAPASQYQTIDTAEANKKQIISVHEARYMMTHVDTFLGAIGLKSQKEKAHFLSNRGVRISQQHYSSTLLSVASGTWDGGHKASRTIMRMQETVASMAKEDITALQREVRQLQETLKAKAKSTTKKRKDSLRRDSTSTINDDISECATRRGSTDSRAAPTHFAYQPQQFQQQQGGPYPTTTMDSSPFQRHVYQQQEHAESASNSHSQANQNQPQYGQGTQYNALGPASEAHSSSNEKTAPGKEEEEEDTLLQRRYSDESTLSSAATASMELDLDQDLLSSALVNTQIDSTLPTATSSGNTTLNGPTAPTSSATSYAHTSAPTSFPLVSHFRDAAFSPSSTYSSTWNAPRSPQADDNMLSSSFSSRFSTGNSGLLATEALASDLAIPSISALLATKSHTLDNLIADKAPIPPLEAKGFDHVGNKERIVLSAQVQRGPLPKHEEKECVHVRSANGVMSPLSADSEGVAMAGHVASLLDHSQRSHASFSPASSSSSSFSLHTAVASQSASPSGVLSDTADEEDVVESFMQFLRESDGQSLLTSNAARSAASDFDTLFQGSDGVVAQQHHHQQQDSEEPAFPSSATNLAPSEKAAESLVQERVTSAIVQATSSASSTPQSKSSPAAPSPSKSKRRRESTANKASRKIPSEITDYLKEYFFNVTRLPSRSEKLLIQERYPSLTLKQLNIFFQNMRARNKQPKNSSGSRA